MPRRYEAPLGTVVPSLPLRLGTALLSRLHQGYSRADVRADLLAGIVVGIMGVVQCNAAPERFGNKWMAFTGIGLGAAGILLSIGMTIAIVVSSSK